jgi:hypothetical protein
MAHVNHGGIGREHDHADVRCRRVLFRSWNRGTSFPAFSRSASGLLLGRSERGDHDSCAMLAFRDGCTKRSSANLAQGCTLVR